jgi:hypothetical protein
MSSIGFGNVAIATYVTKLTSMKLPYNKTGWEALHVRRDKLLKYYNNVPYGSS